MFNFEVQDKQDEFFPNIHIGVVENNIDPFGRGRVQVRIIGLHSPNLFNSSTDGITVSNLPWAIPANPIQGGSVSGMGWSGVPVLGSHVAIFFIGGDHNFPVYFASIAGIYASQPDNTKGFSDPTGKYPLEINVPDFNSLASPTNTVFETPDNGVIIQHDSTPGSEKWKISLKAIDSPVTGDPVSITLANDGICTIDADLEVTGNVSCGNGATGSFLTISGNVVIVQNGIITEIL